MIETHTIETKTHGRYLVRRGMNAHLLVGFHGYGESAEKHLSELEKVGVDWTLVAVQGLHRFYTRSEDVVASWMTRQDRELAIADNIEYVRRVVDEEGLQKAKQLLNSSSCHVPCKIDFWYPTAVSRPYMPDPKRNFEAFQASLNNSGFDVTAHSAPWRPDYRAGVQAGKDQVFLFGWIGDFADPDDFLNIHFGSQTAQFGFNNPALFALLAKADAEPNYDKRTALYQQASVQVMKFLPVIPYVWAGSDVAVKSNVKGYITDSIGPVNEPFANVSIG